MKLSKEIKGTKERGDAGRQDAESREDRTLRGLKVHACVKMPSGSPVPRTVEKKTSQFCVFLTVLLAMSFPRETGHE